MSTAPAPGAPDSCASASTDLSQLESEMIERVLRDTGDNKAKAARRLGLSRMQLSVRLRKYGIA
jgi:transcriptional regulator with GAF, ATPase, and Fis domain